MVLDCSVSMSNEQRSLLYADLARFTRSGFGIDKACESLARQPGIDRRTRAVCEGILEGLASGRTVADSAIGLGLSEMECWVIEAAENGGQLEAGFRILADHFRQRHESRRRIRRGMIYPMVLIHFALVAGIGVSALLTSVNPSAGPGAGKAAFKSGLIWVLIAYAAVLIGIALIRMLSKAASGSAVIDACLRRVPFWGPMRRNDSLARFSEVFRIQLLSGGKMSVAWENAGRAAHSGTIGAATRTGAVSLAAGESLTEVLRNSGNAFPGDFSRSLANADITGRLDEEAAQWASYYREASAISVERFAEWMPKLVYGFALAIGAWMVLKIAFSYLSVINGFLDGLQNI